MSHNEPLQLACAAWVDAALSVLGQIPPRVTRGWEIGLTETGHSAVEKLEPDYFLMVESARRALSSLPERTTIVDMVIADPTLRSALCVGYSGEVPIDPEEQKNNIDEYLDRFLIQYLRAVFDRRLPPNVAEGKIGQEEVRVVFERVYEQLERFIYTDSFPAVWLFFLRNVRSNVVTVLLEPGVAIRQATPDERIELLREHHQSMGAFGGPFFQALETFVEIHRSVDRAERMTPPDGPEALEIARAAVVSLWLLKSNPVGLSGSRWHLVDQPFRLLPATVGSGPMGPWNAFSGDTYILTEADASELRHLWPKVKRAMKDDELATAITRLEDSYGRTKDEDRLIDYWTALESLFLPPDTRVQDMGETVALVVAHYVAQNASERNSVRNDITRSHNLRSHLVHGKRGQPKHDVAEMVSKTGDHLRRALHKRVME